MCRKKILATCLISFILVICTSVYAAGLIHTHHSQLQHSRFNITAFEKQLHAQLLHNKKKINASISRTDFIYRVYRLLETGFGSI